MTYSCIHRWPLLGKHRSRKWAIDAIETARHTQNFELWAYVLMPEHVHLLILPRSPVYEMRTILASLKRSVAKQAREHLEATGNTDWIRKLTIQYPSRSSFRFWQPGGGFDRNIVREKSVPAIMEYIHLNPVRRGLAENPLEWKWSSAQFWSGRRDVPLRMDMPIT